MNHWDTVATTREAAQRAAWDSTDWEATAILSADTIERLLGKLKGHVLEIGCGPGRVTEELARRYPRVEMTGVDSSAEMLRHAPKSRVRYLLGDGKTLPDGPFDFIYSHLVFQHIDPPTVRRYFHEMARVLRKRGRWLVQFVLGREHRPLDHRYSVVEMESFAAAAGLRVDRVESAIYPEWAWMVGDSNG